MRIPLPLTGKLLPIVKQQTDRVGLTRQYNDLAGQALRFGLLNEKDANVERYVTVKALDALYAAISQEERTIRHNPIGAGSAVARQGVRRTAVTHYAPQLSRHPAARRASAGAAPSTE